MKTLFGIIIKIIIAFAILGGIAFFALSHYVSPERIKPYIVEYVQQKYQRTLSLGDIHWNVFPKLGLSLDNVSLSDNPQFGKKTFAAMNTVSVFVDTMSLLKGQINVKTIQLADLNANLKTNKDGVNSWDDLKQQKKAPQKSVPASDKTAAKEEKGLSLSEFTFNIEKIEITNGQLNYVNDKEGANYKISNIAFQGENIALDQSFPVSLKFALSSSAPAVAANVSAKANLKIGMKDGELDTKNMTLNGTVDIPSLKMQGLTVTSLKAPVAITGNNIKLNSYSAALYGGNVNGSATIDASSVPAKISVNYDMKGVQIGSMLKDLNGKDSFTGSLNMKGNVSFKSGTTQKQTLQTLNGNAKVNIQNGVIRGVDLGYFYSMGNNLLNRKNQVPTGQNTGKTDFTTSQANVVITNGLLKNNDLSVINSRIYGAGNGTVNLVSEQINYHFEIQGNNGGKPYGTKIPLQITGSTNNPNLNVDVGTVVKEQVVEQVKGQIGQQIFKALGR